MTNLNVTPAFLPVLEETEEKQDFLLDPSIICAYEYECIQNALRLNISYLRNDTQKRGHFGHI